MAEPKVTIVVSPRERFSYTQASLESIYEQTSIPFKLIYVDGGSPKHIKRYLEEQARDRQFQLIRTEHYLAPNQARNLGLRQVDTKYVMFIDNDVIVSPGWLEKLLDCAQETDATIVTPLICIGTPIHETIHLAGGEAHINLVHKEGSDKPKRRVHEKHYFVNRQVAEVQDQLQRRQCEFAEFHCMLVKTKIFDKIGLLDEGLLSTREHIDFCMSVTNAGRTIYCEPASVVTYVPGPPFEWSDLPFFMLRWSDAWELASLEHFRQKWKVSQNKYFEKRYNRLGHRRHQAFLKPLIRKFSFGRKLPRLEQKILSAVVPLERQLNRYISDRHSRSQIEAQPLTVSDKPPAMAASQR
jgi:GT2 family glycosyltransferase